VNDEWRNNISLLQTHCMAKNLELLILNVAVNLKDEIVHTMKV
jgi:hypothetical protein